MTQISQNVEARIATLPIGAAQREEARAYVQAGEELAEILQAIVHFFRSHSTHTLSHNH